MNHAEVMCRNSPGYYDRLFAVEMAATCKRLSGFSFRVFECRYCRKYHLTVPKVRSNA